ncbi:transposase [Haloarcula amylolytica JCM 13557]|uniref:Transposase n=1 Tax=Haloarcula amylolytica JCM 13557 TaxID=1227452 RepID=M0JVV0_9EURY|nr:transposase [Haloarcula amylolytica JCM 13557]
MSWTTSRKYIDVEVEATFQRHEYAGTNSRRFRVVSVRDGNADGYHLYILPKEEFLPAELATIYRYWWEVELLLREVKTQYSLDECDTSKKYIAEVLPYTALLSLLVSRDLLDLVTEQTTVEIVFCWSVWRAARRSHAQLTLTASASFSATRHRRC